jgi:hypothetical protein
VEPSARVQIPVPALFCFTASGLVKFLESETSKSLFSNQRKDDKFVGR